MLWMENLRLRVSRNVQSEVLKLIRTLQNEMQKSTQLVDWRIYRRARISGDFSILLHWETSQVDPEGSILAYNLIKILPPFGMVDHAIWIAQISLKKE